MKARTLAIGAALASIAALGLTAPAAAAPHGRWVEQTFVIEPHDAMFATHDGTLPIRPQPATIARLTEPALRGSLMLGAKLRNEAGQLVGVATELEKVLPGSDFPSGKIETRTLWTLFLPGRGSITFDEVETTDERTAAIFREAFETGQPWEGDVTTRRTKGRTGKIVGGSEEFAGIAGSGVEFNTLRRFDPRTGELVVKTELRLRYRIMPAKPRAYGPWRERSFFASTPDQLIALTHKGEMPISTVPTGMPKLTEPELATAFVLGAKAEDERGRIVGLITELEFVLPDSDPATGKLRNRTLWTMFLPGRGAIVFNEKEQQDKFFTEVVLPALRTGEPWVGSFEFTTTVPGTGVIVGGTGEFAGITGTGIEVGHLRRFDPNAGVLEGESEVKLRYRLPC